MEDIVPKILTSLGTGSVLAAVLWVIANRFMNETVKQMSLRIDALEKASADCAEDRRTLHSELIDLFKKIAFMYRKNKQREDDEKDNE